MSIASLEKKIVASVNREHKKKFKLKDLMEWSTGEITPQAGEEVFKSKEFSVSAAFKVA